MRRAILPLVAAVALCAAPAGASGAVHLRGTAYEFNNTDVRLAGATIRVAENPRPERDERPTEPTTCASPAVGA